MALVVVAVAFALVSLNTLSVGKTVIIVALALVAYGGLLWSRVLTSEERTWLRQALRSPLTFAFGR
jgi:uncharacterized membrane protein YidH (DUF202 family)